MFTLSQKQQRIQEMVEARKNNESVFSIAKKYGITHQAVSQYLRKNAPEYAKRRVKRVSRFPLKNGICPVDGKKFTFIDYGQTRKYCSRPCTRAGKRVQPFLKGSKEAAHYFYEQQKLKHPERLKEYRKKAYSIFKKKMESDPSFHAKQLAYQREYFNRQRNPLNL